MVAVVLAAALPGLVAGEETEYTLTFDKNGSDVTGTPPSPAQYKKGDVVTLPGRGDMEKPNKVFRGWATSKSASESLDSYSMLGMDRTLYAVWGDSLVVTFKPNEGKMSKETYDGYFAGDSVVNAEATRKNHALAGWYKDSGLDEIWDFNVDKMPDRDLFLYADWKPVAITTSVTWERDYCSVKDGGLPDAKFTLASSGTTYYAASLTGPDGKDGSSFINSKTGTVYSSKTITVENVKEAGDYTLTVKFYKSSDRKDEDLISERGAPLKVVEPVLLKVTITNGSEVAVELPVFFKVDGEKIDGSEQTVKIPAKTKDGPGEKTVEYKYVVRDLCRNQAYSLDTESKETVAGDILGLGVEYSFYAEQKDYSWVTWLSIMGFVVTIVAALHVYRKPVKNVGKPRSRK